MTERFNSLKVTDFKGENVPAYCTEVTQLLTQLEREAQLPLNRLYTLVTAFTKVITRPSPGVTHGTGEDGDGANDGANGNDGVHALESIPIFLRNNHCAILMDDECGTEST